MTGSPDDELVFLPLGGAGEIGMNLNLYGWGPPADRRWLMVDCGIGFNANVIPGADILLPDPAYIVDRRDRLLGLVITHAHEDHLGALPYLWPMLRCPVYATSFTQAMIRHKLRGDGVMAELQPMTIPATAASRSAPSRFKS
ncbi:MAG: MBL fold metallo-hydrolase [Rhodospirillales bacterium]